MRIDRWIRNNIGKIPQSLVEKNLRIGKIKLNKKKVKSSVKLKLNDEINFFNFKFEEKCISKKVKYQPTNEIIKENENLILKNLDISIRLFLGSVTKSSYLNRSILSLYLLSLINLYANAACFRQHWAKEYTRGPKDESLLRISSEDAIAALGSRIIIISLESLKLFNK